MKREKWISDAGIECYELYEAFDADETSEISAAKFSTIIASHAGHLRKVCFDQMVRFISNSMNDLPKGADGKLALNVMLQTLNDVGMEGFGQAAPNWMGRDPQRTSATSTNA